MNGVIVSRRCFWCSRTRRVRALPKMPTRQISNIPTMTYESSGLMAMTVKLARRAVNDCIPGCYSTFGHESVERTVRSTTVSLLGWDIPWATLGNVHLNNIINVFRNITVWNFRQIVPLCSAPLSNLRLRSLTWANKAPILYLKKSSINTYGATILPHREEIH